MTDPHQTIAQAKRAWEDLHGMLCQRVNRLLAGKKVRARIKAKRPRAGLTLTEALTSFEILVTPLRSFLPIPAGFPWLAIGNFGLSLSHISEGSV
jgi:hypothetical protein